MALEHDPAASEPAASVAERVDFPDLFIGRRSELDWLGRHLQRAILGEPQLCLVIGDAGIGKTRLLLELASLARRGGVRVFHGRAHEFSAPPYSSFEPLLTGLAEGAFGSVADDIRRLLPHPESAVPVTGDFARLADDSERVRLYPTITRTCLETARSAAILVVLDDLHWMDRASLDLLMHLTFAAADSARDAPAPLMIAAATRPDEGGVAVEQSVARLRREAICHSLELDGLDAADVDQLVRALQVRDPSHQLVDTITGATRGNPLFVREVLHRLVKEGALLQRGGAWITIADPAAVVLPDVLLESVSDRVAAVSPPCLDLLTLASCLGERFDLATLTTLGDAPRDRTESALDEALETQLVVSRHRHFEFAHPLIRHAVYGRLSAVRRQRLHARIAESLQRLRTDDGDPHTQAIAHHWIAAGPFADPATVVDAARRAGDRALAIYAASDAARCYEAALDAAEHGGGLTDQERGDLHYCAGRAYYQDMDPGPCLHHNDRAIAAYERTGDRAGLTRALLARTRTSITLATVAWGELADVRPLEEALGALGENEPELRGQGCGLLAEAYFQARQPEKARRMAEECLAIGHRLDDPSILARGHFARAISQQQRLDVQAALDSHGRALEQARRARDPWIEGWQLERIPLMRIHLGQLAEAEAGLSEACEVHRRIHDWGDHSLSFGALTALAVARGDWTQAESHAREAMTMARRTGYAWGAALALNALSGARCLRGAFDEAEAALDILVEPGRVFPDPGPALKVSVEIYRLMVQSRAGRESPAARDQARNLLRLLETVEPDLPTIPVWCALAETAAWWGDPDLVAAPARVLDLAASKGMVFSTGCEFLIPRVQGVAARCRGELERAEAFFDSAIEIAGRAGARPEQARAALDKATLLAARGGARDRIDASRLVESASRDFGELGMPTCTAGAEALARDLGMLLSRAGGSSAPEFDERESQLLRSLARGASESELAEEMLLTPDTLRRELRTLFDRLSVDGRTGAVAYALERGLASSIRVPVAPGSRAFLPPIHSGSGTTLFVSDIEGSTELLQRLGDARAQEILHIHNRLVRSCLRTRRGVEIQHTGDGFIASFASPHAAIECAIDVQRAIGRYSRTDQATPIRLRIGLNAGDALPEEGRLFGSAVHAAARICMAAQPGEVLVSEPIRHGCPDSDVAFEARGLVRLKGFAEPFQLHALRWTDADASTEIAASS